MRRLDRDVASVLRVVREPDRGHSPATDLALNGVPVAEDDAAKVHVWGGGSRGGEIIPADLLATRPLGRIQCVGLVRRALEEAHRRFRRVKSSPIDHRRPRQLARVVPR